MFERFTAESRRVVAEAARQATQLHHRHIGTEHLLLALASGEPDAGGPDAASAVLRASGVTAAGIRAEVERLAGTPSALLDDEDAAALRTIGIDLDAVIARLEASFGPTALEPRPAAPHAALERDTAER